MNSRVRSKTRPLFFMAAGLLIILLAGTQLLMERISAWRIAGMDSSSSPQAWLVVSANTRGHLAPCGCRSHQTGGLPARATLVGSWQGGAPTLVVDAGGITYGAAPYDLLKFDYLLRGMESMEYEVVNLGAPEAMLPKEELQKAVRRHRSLTFVSANVLDADSGRPLVKPYAIRRIGGRKVAFLGVTEQPGEPGKGLRIDPPLEALHRWVPRVSGKVDGLVVLAYVDQASMERIARQFYEVDLVLGGDVEETYPRPRKVNEAYLFAVTNDGKAIGRLGLSVGRKRLEVPQLTSGGTFTYSVSADLPPDPGQEKNILSFKGELRRRHLQPPPQDEHLVALTSGDENAKDNRLVGADACLSCHAEAYDVWKQSKHATSLKPLKHNDSEFDPECLACHTLGYGAADGYIDETKTPAFASVQCENCHGRGGRHVENMQRQLRAKSTSLRVVTPATCERCHDEENSEDFSYEQFWPRIEHGNWLPPVPTELLGD